MPLLEAVEACDVGVGVETGSHVVHLVLGGVFDIFPNLTLVLGHLGEMLPDLLCRFDSTGLTG
jgi:predicted TIM-barrel fold metal-dependent hydrolase